MNIKLIINFTFISDKFPYQCESQEITHSCVLSFKKSTIVIIIARAAFIRVIPCAFKASNVTFFALC